MVGPVSFEDVAPSAHSSGESQGPQAPPGAVSFEDASPKALTGTTKADLAIHRDAPGERSGDVANIAAGANESIASTLGMPMDFSNWIAQRFGGGVKKPFGGSEQIKDLMGLIGADPRKTNATTAGERVAREAGGQMTGAVLAGGIAGRIAPAMSGTAKTVAEAFGGSLTDNAIMGFTSGMAGKAAEEKGKALGLPDYITQPMGMLAGIAGAGGGFLAARRIEDYTAERIIPKFQETFQPDMISKESFAAAPDFSKYAAGKQNERDVIAAKQREMRGQWLKVPEDERVQFVDDIQNGRGVAPHAPAWVQQYAARYRTILNDAYFEEQRFGSKASFRADYMPNFWEGDPAKWSNFQKQQAYSLKTGIAAGLKPLSTVPEDMVAFRLMAGADMKARVQLLRDMDGQGLAEFKPTPAHVDALRSQGWTGVNDPNGDHWMISKEIQPLWNNVVKSPSFWTKDSIGADAYRGWMHMRAVWLPIKLAASLFHPMHVAHINFAQHMQLSFRAAANGEIGLAGRRAVEGFNPHLGYAVKVSPGKAAWLKSPGTRTPIEQDIVDNMTQGGFVPQISEERRIEGYQELKQAIADQHWLKVAPAAWRTAFQGMQKNIFENWIPSLKAEAYIKEYSDFFQRHPAIANDPQAKKVALRQIAQSIDNRFGEMFYGGLFWRKTMKEVGQATMISLSWNLGFLREFGGGIVGNPASVMLGRSPDAMRKIAWEANSKSAFAASYVASALVINGLMTAAFTGTSPSGIADYIWPRTGEKNPDGSPHRVTTPFFTREPFMWTRHFNEDQSWLAASGDMIYDKLIIQPALSLLQNKDYQGKDIVNPNAGEFAAAGQRMGYIASQFVPMGAAGEFAKYYLQGDKTAKLPWTKSKDDPTDNERNLILSFLGFPPAPAYADKTALGERIGALFYSHVMPSYRVATTAEQDNLKKELKLGLQAALRKGDQEAFVQAALTAAKGGMSKEAIRGMGVPVEQMMFRQLPSEIQKGLLEKMSPEDFVTYWRLAHKDVKAANMNLMPGEKK